MTSDEIEQRYDTSDVSLGGRPAKYPFRDTPVGGGFGVPAEKVDFPRVRSTIISCMRPYKPMKFSTRSVKGGILVRRTA